ncbi:MAG: DUF1887 family protein [Tyzzerella sp.]|nr:DUF1887 family protein [Tyzzerella sp.]
MTIIESFEKAPIENMISVLTSKARKVIFLGELSQMKNAVEVYEKFLKEKGIETEIVLRGIQKNNLPNILGTLTEIVETEEDCILDATGGEDLVLLAFGIIYERYKGKKALKMQRFNINTGRIIDCDCDDEVTFEGSFSLDVKELISLYGGIVVPEQPQPMMQNAMEEVDKLWELARTNSAGWNTSISFLKEFERKGRTQSSLLEMDLDFRKAKEMIKDYDAKYKVVTKLLEEFKKEGFVRDLRINRDLISYRYKNAFAKRCLTKAGDALEMKAYCEALHLAHNGKQYFNDCYVGVTIDWDGVIHPMEENWKDTTNEIDLMLMRGLIPIFISCKHGEIGEEELYKLNTVATRFGGKYARKMLIATKLEKKSVASMNSYMQRAKDMGIILVPNAGELTKKEWKERLKRIV